MPRALFEKTGNAVFISHLDLMRLFQRAFKRGGMSLTHTQGYNPRPSVSIALPLSVGVQSHCELLDFELEGNAPDCEKILEVLNSKLVEGVTVKEVYENGQKIKHLTYLDCVVTLEYDQGIPEGAVEAISALFARDEVMVEKRSKNGISEQNIIPMIRKMEVVSVDDHCLQLKSRICCQNPTLNPVQLSAAIEKFLPEYKADFVSCCRLEIYDEEENIFR